MKTEINDVEIWESVYLINKSILGFGEKLTK